MGTFLGRVARLVTAFAMAGLAACGGGGGGGADGGGATTGLTVRYTASSANFQTIEGAPPAVRTIFASVTGSTSDPIYIGAEVLQGTALVLPIQVLVDLRTRSAEIILEPRSDLAAGSYSGRLRFLACADPNCARHHGGSPFEFSYSVEVTPRLAFGVAAAGLAVAESAIGDEQTVAVQLPADGTTLALSTSYQQGNGWLSARQAGAGVALRANAQGLSPGTYRATLQAQGGTPQQTATLAVELSVSPGLLVPPIVSANLTSTTPAGALNGNFAVQAAPGVTDARWQASSNQAWLEVTRTSGAAGDALTYLLDRNRVGALANGQTHSATITLTSPAGLSTQNVEFRLHKSLLSIDGIDAFALRAGIAGEVLLYGRFDGVTDAAAHLRIAGAAPSSVQRLPGERVMKVQMPALPVGEYTMTMANDAAVPTPAHVLKVVAPRAFAYGTLATANPQGPLVYDPASGSVIGMHRDTSALVRYAFDGSRWSATTLPVTGLVNLGITPDRSRVVAVAKPSSVLLFDPATLQPRGSISSTRPVYDFYPLTASLPVTGDGRLWMAWRNLSGASGGLQTVDLANGVQQSQFNFDFFAGAASANGRQLLLAQSLSGPLPPASLDLAAISGELRTESAAPFFGFSRIALSRDGTRIAWEVARVYDPQWRLIGHITLPTGWLALRAMVSRDGSRTYVYAQHETSIGTYTEPALTQPARVYVLDSNVPAVPGPDLPIVGSFDLADYPACRVTQGTPECQPYGMQTLLADDDATIFVAGDRRFIAVPVPAPMRPAAAPVAATHQRLMRLQ